MKGNIPCAKEHFSSNAAPTSPAKSRAKRSDNFTMLVLENHDWRKGCKTEDNRSTLSKSSDPDPEHQWAVWSLKDLESANLDDFPDKAVDRSNFEDYLN